METATVPAVAFRTLIERVQYASSKTDMTARSTVRVRGVWLEQETPESLLAVATDGNRLALARGRFSFPLPIGRGQGALLRADALKALSKLAPKRQRGWNLSAFIEGNDLVIQSPGGEVRASRVAHFPDWRLVQSDVTPAGGYVLEPGAGAIVRELAEYAGKGRRVSVTIRSQEVTLEMNHEGLAPVHGEARLRVTQAPVDAETMPPPTVTVNADHLADALEHVAGESGTAALHIGDGYRPLAVVGPYGEAVIATMFGRR